MYKEVHISNVVIRELPRVALHVLLNRLAERGSKHEHESLACDWLRGKVLSVPSLGSKHRSGHY